MCGRYVITSPVEALRALFGFEGPGLNLAPRWNAAPTQDLPVVRAREEGGLELVTLRWGLVPYWATDPSIGSRMINARGESVAEKPAFRAAFKSRRCLVPADGFYEWSETWQPGGKRPYYIHRQDGQPFAFAGLWEKWVKPEGGTLESFAILTTDAPPEMAKLHHRFPVILAPQQHAQWLVPDGDKLAMVAAPPPEWFAVTPVSVHVNNVRNDDAACIVPVDLPAEPPPATVVPVTQVPPARKPRRSDTDDRQLKLW